MDAVDSSEQIKGYPLLEWRLAPPTMDRGRFVLVDRGSRYHNRYLVAWQPEHAEGWQQPTLYRTLPEAREAFWMLCTDSDPVLRRQYA